MAERGDCHNAKARASRGEAETHVRFRLTRRAEEFGSAAIAGKAARTEHHHHSKSIASKSKKLPPLTGIQQQIMAHVFNSIAFQDYDRCCSVEQLAEDFQRTPGRLMPTLRKLVANGYLRIEGDIYPLIYPTSEALRHQDPQLSEHQAQRILRKLKG